MRRENPMSARNQRLVYVICLIAVGGSLPLGIWGG